MFSREILGVSRPEYQIRHDLVGQGQGIDPYADIATAVNRWIFTESTRSQIVNSLLDVADLKSYDSDNKELNKPRREKDKKDVEKIKRRVTTHLENLENLE